MADVVTVREAVQRAKGDGLHVSEYAVRQWIKTGAIPVRMVGQKALLFYPNLVRYLQCDDIVNSMHAPDVAAGIRRIL